MLAQHFSTYVLSLLHEHLLPAC